MTTKNKIAKSKLTLGLCVLLIAAVFSKGYHHFDEHFQILEFAALKLNVASESDMPWEYAAQMRSSIQPTLVFLISKLFFFVGLTDPFIISTFLRMFSAVLAFMAALFLLKTFRGEFNKERFQKWVLPFSFFLWFGVYNAVRFSSENWSAIFFVFGLCVCMGNMASSFLKYWFAGILLGFAFLFRFQIGFMIFGLGIWLLFIRKESAARLLILSLGALVVVGVGVIVDNWFYNQWILSCWSYFDQNILQNKVSGFGVYPWWWYFKEVFLQAIPPFSLVYIVCSLLFFALNPRHVLSFVLIPFLLVHFAIGHKEIRFLFPVTYFLPFVIVLAVNASEAKFKINIDDYPWIRYFMKGFWISNFALLMVVMFRPADNTISLYEQLYHDYKTPVLLFYEDENPYHRVLDIHWYKRKNLSLIKANFQEQLPLRGDTVCIFATRQKEDARIKNLEHRLIYSSLPEWTRYFNYNGWLDRTPIWYLYELH